MAISEWFRARQDRRYTSLAATPKAELPDGVWEKCPACKHILYQGDLAKGAAVCPYCEHHLPLPAHGRVALLVDEGSFAPFAEDVNSTDPLGFTSGKPYAASLERAREASGLSEAVVVGRATVEGQRVVLGVMDFRFIGASMGSAVGERVALAFEAALDERRGAVMVTASGGARMQEGMLSLMQMAKTSAAAERLSMAGLPYVAILTDPTYGGVTASFATLADVTFAEPGALIGFAGPRLVEQTIKQSLPKGFQSSASLVEHGMVDAVVSRGELRSQLGVTLRHLMPKGVG